MLWSTRIGEAGHSDVRTEVKIVKREDHQLQHNRDRGFTFIEMVIVILILGIMTMVALPAMNDFLTDETINAAADAVVTAVYFARTTAIATGANHRVGFDTATNAFQVERYTGGVPPDETFETVQNPLTKRDYIVSFDDGPVGQGVDLTFAAFGLDEYVRFGSVGAPVTPGGVTLEYGGKSRNIGVTATSCEISSS
jgi:prepilin-type N-terminal cleavage/methylation domain-containing protein